MPFITKKEVRERKVGMICDCCGKEDQNLFNDFDLKHTFGYFSPIDMSSVSAAICDLCLLDLVLEKIPDAVFRDENGEIVSREKIAEARKKWDSN